MVIASEDRIQEGILHISVHANVDLHIQRLCANVFSLENLSLCSFVDRVSDETSSDITKDQIKRDFTNVYISDEMMKKVGLRINENVSLLTKTTRESTKFNASREIICIACLREILIETFCDVTEHRDKCQFDQNLTSRDLSTPNNYDECPDIPECRLLSSKYPTNCCNRLASSSKTVIVDPISPVEVLKPASQSNVPEV